MRLRLEPTLNISEEVRVRMQVDALDNVVLGSTPAYSPRLSDREEFSVFSESQTTPKSGINALADSIALKRVYGEVGTPIGILRFGRMGSQWGLGMLHNDGSCMECEHGDTVDRLQFVAEPLPGWFIVPMVDFNVEGPTSSVGESGQPFDLFNSDDAHSYVLALARQDTAQQVKAKLEAGESVLNYGVHFTYRVQGKDSVDYYTGATPAPGTNGMVARNAALYIPDLWLKFERKAFRIEVELAGVFGSIGNRALTSADADNPVANESLLLRQFGGVLQTEFRFLDG
jgi:uncharacterized protein (TIGR04551 family)